MNHQPAWVITSLNKTHDRTDFDCGEEQLNIYLKSYANQHAKHHITKTFIAVNTKNTEKVLGFYTLSAGQLSIKDLPIRWQKKLPRYPIPIARIGRLAVGIKNQGQGLGEFLLMDALYRCAALTKEIGIIGIVVDAKHQKAKRFYERYGFNELTDQPMTLILPIKNVLEVTFSK